MPHLMKFSLGPVQDFIAAARKLEDLWAGSLLLSELMHEALNILEDNQVEIIYPHRELGQVGDNLANLPNVVLCRINNGQSPAQVAGLLDGGPGEGVHAQFQGIVHDVVSTALKDGQGNLFNQVIKDQTRDFLDISWAAAPLENAEADSRHIMELNTRFEAVKRSRRFKNIKQTGVKCTLQTSLSALTKDQSSTDRQTAKFWRDELGKVFKDYVPRAVRNKKGERFSSIGLAKRLLRRRSEEQYVSPFPSTYSVATAKWRADLLKTIANDEHQPIREAYEAFYNAVKDCQDDVSLDLTPAHKKTIPRLHSDVNDQSLYLPLVEWEPQCLTETERANPSFDLLDDPLSGPRRALNKEAQDAGLGLPPKHFTLLLADGDSMGEIVDAQSTKTLPTLSKDLAEFAKEACDRVEEAYGRMVYMGGDDLMAVAPVETSLAVACAWRDAYRKRMQAYKAGSKPATLSVALIVVPVNYPLNRLLQRCHQVLENEAKAEDKDALAMHIYKGDTLTADVVLPTTADKNGEPAWRLEQWAESGRILLQNKILSSKSLYDLLADCKKLDKAAGSGQADRYWRLAGKVAEARLCTARGLKEGDKEKLRSWVGEFIGAMERAAVSRDNQRFLKPYNLGQTLAALQKTWRMWGS
jgi:CRISPR-associated protein Cmr2